MATIRTRTNADHTKVYHVQIRIKGYPAQTATFQRLTDARRWARRTESDIREGRHFPGTAAKRHTVADNVPNWQAYLEWYRQLVVETLQIADETGWRGPEISVRLEWKMWSGNVI